MNLVINYLKDLGVDSSEVLSTYRPGSNDWTLPPLSLDIGFFGPNFNYLEVNDAAKTLDLQAAVKEYRDETIRLAKEAPETLADYISTCVMWLATNSNYKEFVSNSTDLYIKYRSVPPVGIKEGKILGSPVYLKIPKSSLDMSLSEPRGVVTVDTFDAFDRLKLWMVDNWKLLPAYESVEYALSLLKLSGSSLTAFTFEQALHAPDAQVTKMASIFTDEALDEIRDLWAGVGDIPVKFPKLYGRLIDKFVDSKQWKEIFGSFPVADGVEMPARKIAQAARGMDRFVVFYLSKQRTAREENIC